MRAGVVIVAGLIGALFSFLFSQLPEDFGSVTSRVYLAILSFSGLVATIQLIPGTAERCIKARLFGRDINKNGDSKIPESMGLVAGTVYLVCVILAEPTLRYLSMEFNAAMTSICFMILLGFADDVLDLRWRHKIFLSFLATVPLLVAYEGPTDIVVPLPLQSVLGMEFIPLGNLYHVYMALIAVFCTNSINIYAGVNGLEVGQSIVIACSIVVFNYIELTHPTKSTLINGNRLSVYLMCPFIAVSMGLYYYNRFPSQVFVGDTYTYFAGVTIAVAGILGGFSKTLLLLFIPQLLNFAFSLPQLFGIIPCPRHRLPKYNPKTGLLECIPTNLTLINFVLYITGPMSEKNLADVLLVIQVVCSAIGLSLRYGLAHHFFKVEYLH